MYIQFGSVMEVGVFSLSLAPLGRKVSLLPVEAVHIPKTLQQLFECLYQGGISATVTALFVMQQQHGHLQPAAQLHQLLSCDCRLQTICQCMGCAVTWMRCCTGHLRC